MTQIVYAYGTQDITVAALDKISATSEGPFKVYQRVGYPNQPDSWSLLDSVDSAPYTYSSAVITAGGVVRIEAGPNDVSYGMGTAALTSALVFECGAPVAMTTAATITVAALIGGLITGTQSSGATVAYTLPTGAVLDAGIDIAIGQAFEFSILNLSAAAADTLTLTAPASGITIVGEPVVQGSHSSTGEVMGAAGLFRMRKTAAETFICYRIA